jgi:two-component system NtrC family response regulator
MSDATVKDPDRPRGRVLVIDDERTICISCKRILEEDGYLVEFTTSGRDGVKKAVEAQWDVVLLDLKMPDMPGMDVLDAVHKEKPEQVIIIITGYATIQTSIEAIKKGAYDYIPKPFTPEELSLAVSKALEDRRLRSENEYLKEELYRNKTAPQIIGRSKVVEDILNQVLKIAPTDFTVMIYGESGTGKELIAQAIHQNSLRRDRPFVTVDISSLTPTLVESELFGHVKGAFTGAMRNRPGYFSIASGGTLFLDEIANISYDLQGKLLRALESRRIRPVGSDVEQDCDIRLITATNQDLYKLSEEGKFREDLYYRLNVIPITLPPLRNRSEDIPMLTMHFLEKAKVETSSKIKGFTSEAMAKIIAYKWPGNVRELKNFVERLVGTVDSELIGIEHLPPDISGVSPLGREAEVADVPGDLEELKEIKRQLKEKVYEQVERAFVLNALEKSGWNITQAASNVGMQRPNFHALMRKYGIKRGE